MHGAKCNYGRWLNEGEVLSPADGESMNLYGKIAILGCWDKLLHLAEANLPLHLLILTWLRRISR